MNLRSRLSSTYLSDSIKSRTDGKQIWDLTIPKSIRFILLNQLSATLKYFSRPIASV